MNFKPIEFAKKDGTEYLLLCKSFAGGYYYLTIGSYRVDDGFSGNKNPLWLDNSYDEFSTGYSSVPLDPIGFMEINFEDFVKDYESKQGC